MRASWDACILHLKMPASQDAGILRYMQPGISRCLHLEMLSVHPEMPPFQDAPILLGRKPPLFAVPRSISRCGYLEIQTSWNACISRCPRDVRILGH